MAEVLNLKMDNIGTPTTFLDSSASAHTITTTGDAFQVATAINNRRQAYFFDGDSDYITTPDSADWDVVGSSTQDYTLDMWVKHVDHVGDEAYLSQYTNGTNYWEFWHNHGDGLRFTCNASAGLVVVLNSPSAEITDSDWHHVAIVKHYTGAATLWASYLDGVQIDYTSDVNTFTSTGALEVGRWGTSEYFNGHIKNVRISASNHFIDPNTGIAVVPNVGETSEITVPTADPTPDAHTKLLLTAQTPSLNTPLNSTAYLDGTGDYLSVPDHADWDFATNADFTIEGWFRWATLGADNLIGNGRTDGWNLYYSAGTWSFYMDGSVRESGSLTALVNTWYHVAVVRSSDTIKIYIDGVALDAGTSYGTAVASAQNLYIGDDPQTSAPFLGNLKEVRISDSARYTADFIPDTTPFVDDANTLLLLHLDGVPDDTDNTNGWLTDESGTHTTTANGDAACKYIEDYRNRIVSDTSGEDHTGVMVGTAKNDWISVGGNGAYEGDTTGDYVSVANSADFDFGVGDFVFGWWFKARVVEYAWFWDFGGDAFIYSRMRTSDKAIQVYGKAAAINAVTATIPRANEWYYVEANREESSGDLFVTVNGSLVDGATDATATSDIDSNTATKNIGAAAGGGTSLDGWVDEFRVYTGEVLHTGAFIPPVYPTSGESGNAFQVIMF